MKGKDKEAMYGLNINCWRMTEFGMKREREPKEGKKDKKKVKEKDAEEEDDMMSKFMKMEQYFSSGVLGEVKEEEEKKDEKVNTEDNEEENKKKNLLKPDFEVSGLLQTDINRKENVTHVHAAPVDASTATHYWQLFVFRENSDKESEILRIHRQSSYMLGKDMRVVDIHALHPSVSKQHCVIQYRLTKGSKETEATSKPYIMDLNSTNGTTVNGKPIPQQRYYELRDGDVIRLGKSSREYVLMKGEPLRKKLGEDEPHYAHL